MLTKKQQSMLDILVEYMAKYGQSPTIEELQDITKQKSKRGVVQYLEALEKKGYISRGSGFRNIKLGDGVSFQTMLQIPILGTANAGRPLSFADEFDYGTLPISRSAVKKESKDYFVVKVEGTSMNNYMINGKYIESGSYVLIDKSEKVINAKDAFLFVVDGAATLKIPKKEGNNLYLVPRSRDDYHKPIILSDVDNIIVNGKVIDVFNFAKVD